MIVATDTCTCIYILGINWLNHIDFLVKLSISKINLNKYKLKGCQKEPELNWNLGKGGGGLDWFRPIPPPPPFPSFL